MTESSSPWALHQTLTDSFLSLARDQYGSSSGVVDPDVQVGLGTAYYMMGEYEEARNCWVAALGERPNVGTFQHMVLVHLYHGVSGPCSGSCRHEYRANEK